MIKEIISAVTIPVMAKCRIGHFAEAQILQSLGVDMIDESEGGLLKCFYFKVVSRGAQSLHLFLVFFLLLFIYLFVFHKEKSLILIII